MRFTGDHLELLTKAVVKQITEKEDEVFVYVGNGSYVLDQDGLEEAVRTALEAA
jgi:hypothetical protein